MVVMSSPRWCWLPCWPLGSTHSLSNSYPTDSTTMATFVPPRIQLYRSNKRPSLSPQLTMSLTNKGLLNPTGENNCFLNSAVQVGTKRLVPFPVQVGTERLVPFPDQVALRLDSFPVRWVLRVSFPWVPRNWSHS